MIANTVRLTGRLLPAVLAATLLAGCTSGASTEAAAPGPGASPSASPSTSPTPEPSPTPTPKPTGEADPGLKPFYGQQITWSACADDPKTAKADESTAQCARLRVPLDYAAPGGEVIELALARRQTAQEGRRIGHLLLNPGGPGSSGVSMVAARGTEFGKDGLRESYDLVGFDPRGVGASTAVHCMDDRARDEFDSTDVRDGTRGKAMADACQANSGKLLPHVGTRDAARDLDVLRGALGEPKLNYLGFSYGTYLGSRYIEQFPDKVGRVVLDGAVDSTLSQLDHAVQQNISFEKALNAFAADCVKQKGCSLGKDPEKAAGKLAAFLDGLKKEPLTTSSGRKLTASSAWIGTLSMLYGNATSWEYLRNAVAWAMLRDKGDYLLAMADDYYRRGEDGKHTNMLDAYTAIHCADPGADVPTEARLAAAKQKLRDEAPLISARYTDEDLFDPDCRSWPYRTSEQPGPTKSNGAPPVLVVGTTGDPATPYAWAEQLTAQLGNATLLTREGEGHLGYNRSKCTFTAVNTFLTTGTLPPPGTRCTD
ncbi:alpha/beta hydrolase [Kitasatospora sp. NPDC051853]|uniref:alpha/beta hydrolase n=1 Tax=Kitasatospora sp. NPDC051853 TaxID=3364058 RepID=UPI00379DA243